MRWYDKPPKPKKIEPKPGDYRTRWKFAWRPVKMGKLNVWLEYYILFERLDADVDGSRTWTPLYRKEFKYQMDWSRKLEVREMYDWCDAVDRAGFGDLPKEIYPCSVR